MSTTTLDRLPEPHDAATVSQNRHLPEVSSNGIGNPQGVNEKDRPKPNAVDLVKSVEADEHSFVQTETISFESASKVRPEVDIKTVGGDEIEQEQQQALHYSHDEVPDMGVLTCAVCNAPTVQLCKRCRSVAYCNREHQRKDWSRHNQDCLARSELAIGSISFLDPGLQARKPIDRLTPGKLFEVHAILIPAGQPFPQIVKAAYEVVADEVEMKIKHEERCFNKLLGPAVPWVDDAQWDEHVEPESGPFVVNVSPTALTGRDSVFSLHCRPNGTANKCYETLAGKQKSSSRTDTPVWGMIDPKDKHLHGNGSFLVLKHPPRTSNAHLPGSPVIDASLHDVKHIVWYLKQRQFFMNATGGARMNPPILPPMLPPPTIPLPPGFVPPFVPSPARSRSESPVRGRSITRSRSPDTRQPGPPRVPQPLGIPFSPPFSPQRTPSHTKPNRIKRLFG